MSRQFEAFVLQCIEERASFAIETTLRSVTTFEQSALARRAGFATEMRYLALRDFHAHMERVKARADAGGHSASEASLRRSHRSSLANLPNAIANMDNVWVYDNSAFGGPPRLVLEAQNGTIRFLANDRPDWLVASIDLR